jgi:hypothetical protein
MFLLKITYWSFEKQHLLNEVHVHAVTDDVQRVMNTFMLWGES